MGLLYLLYKHYKPIKLLLTHLYTHHSFVYNIHIFMYAFVYYIYKIFLMRLCGSRYCVITHVVNNDSDHPLPLLSPQKESDGSSETRPESGAAQHIWPSDRSLCIYYISPYSGNTYTGKTEVGSRQNGMETRVTLARLRMVTLAAIMLICLSYSLCSHPKQRVCCSYSKPVMICTVCY
jgi:hypothetical protein